ncbi:MAG: histidine phosphatase family protein [Candidatus Micrarchaeota archaeon]
MKRRELYVFRHARAGGNSMHILNGSRRDVGLTSFGRRQARKLAAGWKIKPDVIVSSPMRRAKQTAYYFAKKYGKKIEFLDLLKEHDLGDWTGRSAAKLKHEFPDYFFDYEDGAKSHFLKKVPGGESWEQSRARAGKALEEICRRYRGKKVAVFAHGIITIAMVNLVYGIKPPRLWNYRLKNCEYVKFLL